MSHGPGLLAGFLSLALAVPALAGTVEVEFRVPVRAQLDLREKGTVTILPFLIATEEGEAPIERRGVNVREEFENYLRRLLRRRTHLKYVEAPAIDYPTYDLAALARDTDFWRVVGERSASDLILTGSLDFDVQDRSGYRTEEYISPFDGRTYYRQVLVEQTGFEYDIVMQVYDGASGALLHSDNFKDFRQFEGEGADPLAGMFENLYALEDRIAGVFAQKDVPTTRVLFTD
jgi:hypothetical protein